MMTAIRPNGPVGRPATDKQKQFIRNLLVEREATFPEAVTALRTATNHMHKEGKLTTLAASQVIDALLMMKVKRTTAASYEKLEDGMYRSPDGTIRKVYVTVHGAHQQVAKRLVVADDGSASFEYEGKRGLRGLRPEHRLTLEEAKKFGHVYGICCVCSATLTNEVSIEAGIGPVCGGRI